MVLSLHDLFPIWEILIFKFSNFNLLNYLWKVSMISVTTYIMLLCHVIGIMYKWYAVYDLNIVHNVMLPSIYINNIASFYKRELYYLMIFEYLDLFLEVANCCIDALICWSFVMLMRISSQYMHVRIYYLMKMLAFNPL